jgi:peptidyl-prolyl cis-trans isomerase D
MSSIAGALGSKVQITNDVNFGSTYLPDVGIEPAVIGTAVSLAQGVVSEPVKGNSGVFLIKVTSVKQNAGNDLKAEKDRLAQEFLYSAGALSLDVHKKAVKIVDKRPTFY